MDRVIVVVCAYRTITCVRAEIQQLQLNGYNLLTLLSTGHNIESQLLGKEKLMRIIVGLVTAVLLPVAVLVVAMRCAKAFVERGIR